MTVPSSLISKYNVPGPRYTSYPTPPYWELLGFSEQAWRSSIDKSVEAYGREISLYIHLPFCESMCTFCGCHKHITRQHGHEVPYIDALIQEWNMYLDLFEQGPIIKEIHLGGGTPTFFSAKNLQKLITSITDNNEVSDDFEFGFEGHPNNTSKEHLQTLYDLGFRRVSFGVQDYNPTVQKAINRIQPFENVEKVHNWAREIGYTSISHDLVFGLPHQTLEDVENSINLTNQLHPDRISFYSYAHVPWIKGLGQRGFDENDLPSPGVKRMLYETGKELLDQKGYYEVGMDHFALESDTLFQAMTQGTLHRNFMGYTTTDSKLLIGIGMSAISDSWFGFAQNEKSLKEYYQRLRMGRLPVFRGHMLTAEDLRIRQQVLDLMCRFETTIEPDQHRIVKRLGSLIEDGLAELEGDILRATPRGQIFIRNICMCFDERLHKAKPETRIFSMTV